MNRSFRPVRPRQPQPARRRLTGLAAFAGLGLTTALTGCSAADSAAEGPTIVASFYPLAWTAEQIAGDHFTVEDLTRPGAEPHDLELSIRQISALASADLVVYESNMQPAVDEAVDTRAEGAVLDATDVVDPIPFDEEHDHAEEEHATEEGHEGHDHSEGDHADATAAEDGHDGHDHGDLDPHFWLDPLRVADLGDAVAAELGKLDPEHAEEFTDNAQLLHRRLAALDTEYTDGLAGCQIDTIVVSHQAFGYLGKYGLHMDSILGLSPEAEPTAAVLADLRTLIQEKGITTVFSERLASAQVSDTLARSAGVETAVLDPIEGLTDETSKEDYLSLMRSNLEALQKANRC